MSPITRAMMIGKTGWSLLTAVVLILAGGLGYAAFTSQITANVTASAGTLAIEFTSVSDISPSQSYITCNVNIVNPTTLKVDVSNMAPGDSCSFKYTITNTGSLPASLSRDPAGTFTFNHFQYADNLPSSIGASGTPTASVTVTATISALSTVGQDESASTTITIKATAGT
jgi:hypothetical protein